MGKEKMEGRGRTMLSVGWIAVLVVNLAVFALGMMLPSMREDLGFGIEASGYLSAAGWIFKAFATIPIALCVAKINPKYVLVMVYLAAGLALIFQGLAANVEMLMVGRALTSIASAGILAPLVPIKISWVPQKRMTQINGIENCISPVGQALGTVAVTSMIAMLGGWRNVMIALGTVMIVVGIVFFVVYREKEGHEFQKSDAKFLEPLKEALKLKEVWLLAIGWPGTSLVWIATYTFWPTYATETLGLTLGEAGFVLGLFPIASAIASFISPSITNKIGYDKLMLWPWGFILPVAYYGMLQTSNMAILCLCSIVAGFGAYAFVPIAFTTLYKIPNVKPRTVTLGTSCILTMVGVGSSLGGTLAGILGETMGLYKAMAVCCLSPLIFGILCLFLPEKGRRYQERMEREGNQ